MVHAMQSPKPRHLVESDVLDVDSQVEQQESDDRAESVGQRQFTQKPEIMQFGQLCCTDGGNGKQYIDNGG
jgi:hypothetical protein